MQTLVVRTQQDLNACLEIRREVFIQEQGVPEALEMDELDVLESGAGVHVLIRDDAGRAVATGRLKDYSAGTAKFQRVAVREDVRSHGYGVAVMKALENSAKDMGFEQVVLDAQCTAEGFYRKLDYQVLDTTRFLDAGIEHVKMGKRL